jgi:MFS family permease
LISTVNLRWTHENKRFRWLWTAFAVSTLGSWLAFDAFPLIAILVLHARPAEVSLLAAAGLAVGALVAVPLGPWVEFRRKRPVMIAMDLARCGALLSVPAAFLLGRLGFAQLLLVSVVAAAADIAFRAAAGACLKELVPPADRLAANGRLESTAWAATVVGPPLGGAAIAAFGPVVTVIADAVSYLLSAAAIRAIGDDEPSAAAVHASAAAVHAVGDDEPSVAAVRAVGDGESSGVRRGAPRRMRAGDLLDGWRQVLGHPALRPLFFNTVLVNGLILATSPLLAVLMLGRLGFAPWQYGLAFAVPCVGGLVGSRLAHRLVARFGRHQVMLTTGVLRACWSAGLAFIGPGTAGLVLVIVVEFGLITCMGVFNPVFATYRLDQTATDQVARTLTAWSVTSNATVAALTAAWGVLATVTGARTAIAIAGVLLLGTPLLLPRHDEPQLTEAPSDKGRVQGRGDQPGGGSSPVRPSTASRSRSA